MFKLIGICLVMIASTAIGFQMANRLKNRTKQLRQLQAALKILESEISYGQVPLFEAAKKIATQIPHPLSQFFRILSHNLEQGMKRITEIFQESLQAFWQETVLCNEEYEIMKQFGQTLGKHDRYAQQQQIEIALTYLNRLEKEASQEQMKFERMYQTLGVLFGLLVVILFI